MYLSVIVLTLSTSLRQQDRTGQGRAAPLLVAERQCTSYLLPP